MTENTEQITYSTLNIHNVYVLVPDLGIHKLNTQWWRYAGRALVVIEVPQERWLYTHKPTWSVLQE